MISVYPVVLTLGKLGQEDCEFVAGLSYTEGLSQHRGANLSNPRKLGSGWSQVQVQAFSEAWVQCSELGERDHEILVLQKA